MVSLCPPLLRVPFLLEILVIFESREFDFAYTSQDPNNRYLKEIEHPPAAASTTPLYQRQPRGLGTAPLASLAET